MSIGPLGAYSRPTCIIVSQCCAAVHRGTLQLGGLCVLLSLLLFFQCYLQLK